MAPRSLEGATPDGLCLMTSVLCPQLLWTVDQGQALEVSGVADTAMRGRLVELLSNLPLLALRNVQSLCKSYSPDVL